MPTLGIELCDAAVQAATCSNGDVQILQVADDAGAVDWPGFAYHDGQKYFFGRVAEDQWFVHPRRVAHTFWTRLAHEPSTIGPAGKPAALSELAFHFFREFAQRATATSGGEKIVLAVPGAYLKYPATEEEKIGLLLGMAGELKLPLAGIVDMACAALCDPRSTGFNPALPVIVVDLHLEGADVTLVGTEEHLERRDFIHLASSGYAQLLKHLTATMGNRFLRHTAFDILEDGRIEQTFFRQTKDFLLSAASEHRYQINTATRTYEMIAKREQLATDAAAFVATLVQGIQSFAHNSPHSAEPCTLALTERTGRVPGLETKLRAAGFHRILRLPAGAAAGGAARIGESRLKLPADLGDVPVETAVPIALAQRSVAAEWDARLQKLRQPMANLPPPTHVIFDGLGTTLGSAARFTIGLPGVGADIALPESFNAADDCTVPLVRDGGRLWFVDTALRSSGGTVPAISARTAIDTGDRLTIRCGTTSAEFIFAHCGSGNGAAARG